MRIVVLHDRYSNLPLIIRVDAITVIRKVLDGIEEEYSGVNVSETYFEVMEHIDVVMSKIKNAEQRADSEDKK